MQLHTWHRAHLGHRAHLILSIIILIVGIPNNNYYWCFSYYCYCHYSKIRWPHIDTNFITIIQVNKIVINIDNKMYDHNQPQPDCFRGCTFTLDLKNLNCVTCIQVSRFGAVSKNSERKCFASVLSLSQVLEYSSTRVPRYSSTWILEYSSKVPSQVQSYY